jgi:hypothetical protein
MCEAFGFTDKKNAEKEFPQSEIIKIVNIE